MARTAEDITIAVFDWADQIILQTRLIRKRVQQGKHVDPSDVHELKGLVESLRHNCEMHNAARLTPEGGAS